MPLADDGDIVRGLGFITMYAAWVEEDTDDLLRMMDPVEPFDEKKQRWQISRKLEHAAKLVRALKSHELDGLPEALEGALALFQRRNEFVHGRIYAGHDRVDYIRGGRPNAPTNPITSAELYALANEMDYRDHFIGPQLFRLPRAIGRPFNSGASLAVVRQVIAGVRRLLPCLRNPSYENSCLRTATAKRVSSYLPLVSSTISR